MSAQASSIVVKNSQVKSLKKESRSYLMIPMAMAAIPFIPTPITLAVAAYCGYQAAKRLSEASKVVDNINHDSRYKTVELKDSTVVRHVFIGVGLDMIEFKNGLDEISKKNGIVTSDDRRQYAVERMKDMKPVYLQDEIATRHVAVFGSTGLGKTELFTSIILQNIKRGGGAILFDAKADEKLLTRLYFMCKKFGREQDLMFINFERPDISHTYNPILFGNARQIISTAMKLQGATKEEFFKRLNRNAMAAAIVTLLAQPEKIAFNFTDLAVLFNDLKEFIKLYQNIPKEKVEEREFVYQFLKMWKGYDNREKCEVLHIDKYRERLMGLFGICMDFSHSEYRSVINAYNPDIELKSVILESKIVVVAVPALSDKEGVQLFGQLFLADLSRAIGDIQLERTKPLLPFYVFLDEYGSFKHESHQELFQLARSAGISLVLSVQGRGFLANESEYFADNLLTNTWTHIYLDVRDIKTREAAAALAGSTIRQFATESTGENFGYSSRNSESGAVRTENEGKSVSKGFKETREELLQADDFYLEEGDAIMVGKSGVMRLRLPLTMFDEDPPELDDIKLPHFDKIRVKGLNLMSAAMPADGGFSHLVDDD